MNRNKVYEYVTERITKALEQGKIPWQKPWNGGEAPKNLVSGKTYRGINVWLLAIAGYESPYWLTFNQVKKKGGSVKAGAKSSLVVYWSVYEVEVEDKETGEKKKQNRYVLRYYRVFNVEQTTDVKYPKPKKRKLNVIEEAEKIANGYKDAPEVQHKENRAYYNPEKDLVNLPKKNNFKSDAGYYATLFHEYAHSTGHEKRLKRDGVAQASFFGGKEYSKEELVAELGASYLCGVAGIENKVVDNTVAYIQSWLKALKDNRKWVVFASAKAQKAADYILGNTNKEDK